MIERCLLDRNPLHQLHPNPKPPTLTEKRSFATNLLPPPYYYYLLGYNQGKLTTDSQHLPRNLDTKNPAQARCSCFCKITALNPENCDPKPQNPKTLKLNHKVLKNKSLRTASIFVASPS